MAKQDRVKGNPKLSFPTRPFRSPHGKTSAVAVNKGSGTIVASPPPRIRAVSQAPPEQPPEQRWARPSRVPEGSACVVIPPFVQAIT